MDCKKNLKSKFLVLLLIVSCLFSTSCSKLDSIIKDSNSSNADKSGTVSNANVKVHVIDVGQADSIFIESDGVFMLIDGGNTGDSDTIINYLKEHDVKKLEYVIGTHPHEDHIGGLDKVIDAFDVEKVILPDVQTTTKTFKELLTSISNKGLKYTKATTGDNYDLGKVSFTILGPNADYKKNYNDWSVVTRLVDGDISYMLTGDAEETAEKDIIATGQELDCDVLKCGHHGSNTATSDDFFNQVTPTYALISCGEDNKYKHPHQSTLDKLDKANVKYVRTDLSGTIIASSDGKKIQVTSEKNNDKFDNGSKGGDAK